MSIPFGVIDIHVHIQPWWQLKPEIQMAMAGKRENLELFVGIMTDPKKLLAIMDREGIEKLGMINYVSPEVMGFTTEVNQFVSDYQKAAPERLIAFGSVHPRFCNDVSDEMERLVDHLKIRAIKIHPPHQLIYPNEYRNGLPGLELLYRKAQEFGLPVMVHTGTSNFPNARSKYGDPIYLDDVALDFPELKIILAHGGRPLWMSTAFFLTRRHKNVYLDISSIPPQSVLEYFPKLEIISDKVLWGTDWPAPQTPGMGENAQKFWNLPLPDETKRKILRDNAFQIFQ